ncbi:MAG TPA: DUF4124 domain-containing protein [Burkholderiales bacterium]|nr:DUF4124 domain-containing protein [Burkholderiales bacterium]
MNSIARKSIAALTLLALVIGANAFAQERKAYRHVDAAGNVTYSQTPPVDGKDAKRVDIAPAQRGRGGNTAGYSPYDDPRYYSRQPSYDRYATATQPTAQERRLAMLKAECERQRGTDCNNPAALQYQDSTSIPRRGGRYH